MNPAWIHLVTAHVPVIGVPLTAVLMLIAFWKRSALVWAIGVGMLFATTLLGGMTYLSGPPAYELLEDLGFEPHGGSPQVVRQRIETHAVAARAAYVLLWIPTAVVAAQGLRVLGGEQWPRWLQLLVPLLLFAISGFFAYAAHLGGLIRHPELLL